MAQSSWNYTFPYGKKYEIGLFHGNEGHVVLYCEGEIIKIDFNVHETVEYSFFVENVLLTVLLEKDESGDFAYFLKENKPEETPILRDPKAERVMKYVSYIILISFCILLIWIFSFYRK
ncbi:MAG: hypothetical protein IPN79_02420 [Saprospiraceae bacterium]|nr:hypothetical protein [Saprospiraceae bacterium]